MKKNQHGVVLVLAAVCVVSACAPRHPPETAAGETSKTVPRSNQNGTASATTASPTPSEPGEPGAGCSQGCATPPAGCQIKGNINLKTGDRVYHVPGQMHYDNVTIEPERGEKWFCTEDEALANGWKRARR
jgi:hypothetical protein